MSLLIKALANAEKDKQAELSKKRGKAKKVESGLALELAPVEEKASLAIAESDVADIAVVKTEAAAKAPAEDAGLSLAVEAGLVNAAVAKPQAAEVNASAVTPSATTKAQHKPTVTSGVLAATAGQPASSSVAKQSKAGAGSVNQHQTGDSEVSQKVAANVFVANQAVRHTSSKSALIALGVAGALMIWLGIEGSRYLTELTTPEVVISRPAPIAVPATELTPTNGDASASAAPAEAGELAKVAETTAPTDSGGNQSAQVASAGAVFKSNDNEVAVAAGELDKPVEKQRKEASDSRSEVVVAAPYAARNSQPDAAKSAPLQVSSRTPAAAVDPTLLAAYQAFSRGDDSSAQQQYRQVLQRDVRNVDALLGMAAIALRQGRDADAMGWYQKVLEIEPKNTIAQSAIVRPQANVDAVGAESRIKNLLAQQPEAANLYAALGNLYAEQNQWAAAQDAYFNASRFAPNSADYAFNLAISLDQLGKSGLALAQYQRALSLLDATGATTPDRAQLAARIQALQSVLN